MTIKNKETQKIIHQMLSDYGYSPNDFTIYEVKAKDIAEGDLYYTHATVRIKSNSTNKSKTYILESRSYINWTDQLREDLKKKYFD